jgi:hypothetical protein
VTTKALIGYYDCRLVALSVLIAVFASYTALDLAGRTTGRNWPGSPHLARGRGDCYGRGHLVHALYRNAGFQLTGAGAVRLADGVAVARGRSFRCCRGSIRRKSEENGLASGQTGSKCATARLRVAVRANFGVPRPNAKSGRSGAARSFPAEGSIRFQFLKYVFSPPQGRLHIFADVFATDDILEFRLVDQLRRLFSRAA